LTAALRDQHNAAQEQHREPILIPDVHEPDEMLVEPSSTSKVAPKAPERVRAEAIKAAE
jgi:hypothetical protein